MFLREVEPDSVEDREALVQMRIACGWQHLQVPFWLESIRAGDLLLWFICEPTFDDGVNPSLSYDLCGMIGLVIETPPSPENTISLSQNQRVSISSLFIYPQYRGKKYARQAWLLVEEEARKMGAKSIEINTSIVNKMGTWYERMGYKRFKTIEEYYRQDLIDVGVTASKERCVAAFLEKYL
jgi:ribosomal protein S18 acetylase RimI-like enzyme